MSKHDYSNLKEFDISKELFEQDFEVEICDDENFVPFPCIKIERIEQLFSLFKKIFELEKKNKEFFYRGHYNSDWLLECTLEREIKNKRISIHYFKDKIFDDFKENLRGFLTDQSLLKIRHNEDIRELWAIGRHHDLKTPYLDWTKSIYVALFMAYSEPEKFCEYSSIFMVNPDYFPEYHGLEKIYWFTPKTDYYGRINAQNGYLSEYTIRDHIKSNLEKYSKCAIKIYINNNLKQEIVAYLNHIGIKYTTMYPDLLGVVKYTNNQLAEYLNRCGDK
ncbi:FRG domain-containing protein [Moraxella bovis]|uniref:FRG domain-containing protein n=1 Tax=Moraxella bovis TaxID=476 RepID=UPI0013C37911|nr:FRG domain-containing protein [Moraxella bovis]UYZ89679.1 FRG domain-containing protein [Moraxella bovis]UYZ95226.1 FRG domain-containing protein [Moraxella bovis]